MERRTWAVLGLVGLCVSVGVVFANLIGPHLQALGLLTASDAARIKGTIRIGGDNYLGYWFLTSSEFAQRLRQRGYSLSWTNDHGDYEERHKKFADGGYDLMVLPISSYLLHGLPRRYPGVIPVALSESKGADSIVGYADRVVPGGARPPTINDLNNPDLKICLTPDSPSQFLLDIAIAHFALDDLKKKGVWSVPTSGSDDAYGRLRNRQCDVAVVWEPDVSKALAIPGVTTIFGSDQVSGMIIDVFVVRRQLAQGDPDLLDAFFGAYFDTLSYYRVRRDQLVSDIAKDSVLPSRESTELAVDRIAWFGLADNCRDWFNLGLPGIVSQSNREKVVDSISDVTNVMIRVGDLATDPLAGNPYTITTSDALKRICAQVGTPSGISAAPEGFAFPALTDEEWAALRIIGRIRVLPIGFDPSTSRLTREGASTVDQMATA
ncbi:MAG: nitrate transporter substrate-binding protein, partial [Chloroflexi bacterium]|nr:nitrate transporter substrate-binding protein [Chloroflexota bacterium]